MSESYSQPVPSAPPSYHSQESLTPGVYPNVPPLSSDEDLKPPPTYSETQIDLPETPPPPYSPSFLKRQFDLRRQNCVCILFILVGSALSTTIIILANIHYQNSDEQHSRIDTFSCNPSTSGHLILFGYSNNLEVSVVQDAKMSMMGILSRFKIFVDVRFDTEVPAELNFHYDATSFVDSINNHPPQPWRSRNYSDVFQVLRRFIGSASPEVLCGSKLYMLTSAAPKHTSRNQDSDLLALFQSHHIYVHSFSMGNTNMDQQSVFNASALSNGLAVRSDNNRDFSNSWNRFMAAKIPALNPTYSLNLLTISHYNNKTNPAIPVLTVDEYPESLISATLTITLDNYVPSPNTFKSMHISFFEIETGITQRFAINGYSDFINGSNLYLQGFQLRSKTNYYVNVDYESSVPDEHFIEVRVYINEKPSNFPKYTGYL